MVGSELRSWAAADANHGRRTDERIPGLRATESSHSPESLLRAGPGETPCGPADDGDPRPPCFCGPPRVIVAGRFTRLERYACAAGSSRWLPCSDGRQKGGAV